MIKIKAKDFINLAIVFIWFFILYFSLSASFEHALSGDRKYSDGKYYLVFEVATLVYILFKRRIGIVSFNTVCATFGCVQVLGLMLADQLNVVAIMRSISWIFFLIVIFEYSKDCEEEYTENFINLLSIGYVLLSIFIIIKIIEYRVQIVDIGGVNEIYTILLAFPIIFACKNILIKSIAQLSTIVMVLLALKATAVIAILAAYGTFFFVSPKIDNKKISKWIIRIIFFLLVAIAAIYVINSFGIVELEGGLLNKFLEVDSTGGSGRIDIWKDSMKIQSESSLVEFLLGHGYNTLVNYIGFSAHNDFIEVMFDYGLIGLVLYVFIYIILIKQTKMLIKNKNKYAPILAVSTAMTFVVSMTSHLVIYNGLLTNCAIVWGLCISENYRTNVITEGRR